MNEDRISRIEVKIDSILDNLKQLEQRLDIYDEAFEALEEINAHLQAEISTIRINQKVDQ